MNARRQESVKGKTSTAGIATIKGKRTMTSIEAMQALAKQHGGQCLSPVYKGVNKMLRWRCAQGHEWDATPTRAEYVEWCPKCAAEHKYDGMIEEMQVLAKARGGKCLSTTYAGASQKLKWQCAKGHQWEVTPNAVKNLGTWCKICAGRKPHFTIEHMRTLAEKFGGQCLSRAYEGHNKTLRWRCAQGHEWDATPGYVKLGNRWCPECRKNERHKRKLVKRK